MVFCYSWLEDLFRSVFDLSISTPAILMAGTSGKLDL